MYLHSKTKLPATPSLSPLTAKQTVKSSQAGREAANGKKVSVISSTKQTRPPEGLCAGSRAVFPRTCRLAVNARQLQAGGAQLSLTRDDGILSAPDP